MTDTDNNLRYGLIISVCVHAALLLLLYFGMPTLFKPLPTPPFRIIPIEIKEISDITNTSVTPKPEETVKPPEPQSKPEPPQPKTEVKPTPPAPEQVKPEQKPVVPEEKTPDVPLPAPQQKPKPPEPPKPVKPQPDQLDSILKNLTAHKPAPPSEASKATEVKDKSGENKSLGPSLSDRLTMTEEDALRRQISQCWNIPIGARDAESLVVEVLIEVNQDRTVRSAVVTDQSRVNSDPFYRAAAESALRALRNPKCSPLELPPDKYEEWKTIRFNFDPKDML